MSQARTNSSAYRLLEQTLTVPISPLPTHLQGEEWESREMLFVVSLELKRGGDPKQDAGLILNCLVLSLFPIQTF